MATPFVHTHVSHVSRTRRRRSQSVTLPNSNEEDILGASFKRKQFLAQLRSERQKSQDKNDGQHQEENERSEEHQPSKDGHYQPTVSRVAQTATTVSVKKNASSTKPVASVLKKEVTSISSATTYSDENENHHEYQPSVVRIPLSDSKSSLSRKMSTKTGKSSNGNGVTAGKNSKLDSFTTLNGAHGGSSQISSYPLLASSINITSKSDTFDQDFHLDDPSDHAQRNDTKHHGKIVISGPEKYYTAADRRLAAASSTSFMTAIIAIIIAIIAFAFALTSLVLVLLVRSTVNAQQSATTSINSNSSSTTDVGTWTAACSSYTTLNDPTRNVNAPGYALGCDNTAPFLNQSTPVWIRFVGTGGTMLPLTTPGMNICGSQGTGWYDGTMPSSGQIVNGTVCFTWTTSVCRYSQMISVANCDSFYIYLLPPAPACMMRYCTI